MKKVLATLMALAMIVSVVACLAVTTSAAPKMIEPTYEYAVGEEYGTEAIGNNPVFCKSDDYPNGLWAYEWRNADTGEFAPMALFVSTLPEGTEAMGGQSNFYTPDEDCLFDTNHPSAYCLFRSNGKQMHPGNGSDAVLTFIVPANGTVSYELKIHATGSGNTTTGDSLAVYLNDKMVWPADGEPACMLYDESNTPTEVSIDTLKVKEGDKIRFAVGSNGNKGSKATQLDMNPLVTYLESDVKINNFFAPTDIATADVTDSSCKVTWTAANNAVSYNVYLNGEKVNTAPITGTEFALEGLEANTSYISLTVASVDANGEESLQSDPIGFRTKKGTGSTTTDTAGATDPATDATTNTAASNTAKATDNKTAKKDGFPIWLLIVIIAVVLVAAAVVVLLLLKKKKAAPAEEEASAEEEKKDE